MFGFRAAATGVPPQDHSGRIHACTHARMHGAAAAVCANAFGFRAPKRRRMRCLVPRTTLLCCKPTARHDGTQPAGAIRQAHAASARQRAESCATASRAHACVCAPAGRVVSQQGAAQSRGPSGTGMCGPGRYTWRAPPYKIRRCPLHPNALQRVTPGSASGPVSAGADVGDAATRIHWERKAWLPPGGLLRITECHLAVAEQRVTLEYSQALRRCRTEQRSLAHGHVGLERQGRLLDGVPARARECVRACVRASECACATA